MRRAGILLIIATVGCSSPEPLPEPAASCAEVYRSGLTPQLSPPPTDRAPDVSDLAGWLARGHHFLAEEQLDEASACYEHVLTLEAEQPIALYNLGLIEYDRENY